MIDAAVEVTGSLVDVFGQILTSQHLEYLSSFISVVLDSQTYGVGKETHVVAAGHAFPHGFPDRIIFKLHQDGVHRKLRDMLTYYSGMKEEDLSSILTALLCFIDFNTAVVSECVSESTHYMMLFAAEHFSRSYSVHKVLWAILSKFARCSPQFGSDVGPEVLVPLLTSIAREQLDSGIYIDTLCIFLISYIMNVHSSTPLVPYCLKEDRLLVSTLLRVLDKPQDDVKSKEDFTELEAVADLMILFCTQFKPSAVIEVLENNIISKVEEAAVKWPRNCCLSMCECIEKYISQLPPDMSSLPPALRDFVMKIPPEFTEAKSMFLSQNHFKPFTKILLDETTFGVFDVRLAIYLCIKLLLKFTPDSTLEVLLTKEFIDAYVKGFQKDLEFPETLKKLHVYVFTSHFLTYCCKSKELIQILYENRLHDIAVNLCLKKANYVEAYINTLNFINCILRSYQDYLKDIKVFAEGDLLDMLIHLANVYGRGPRSHIGEQFGALILGLTADKTASSILHEREYLPKLYPLVDKEYDPLIIRSSIHAVGNIALAGHPVKQQILADGFHKTLIEFLNKEMSTADVNVIVACCRVLHILSSGDWAKRQFAELGLVNTIIRLLSTRKDTPEVMWRPLGLLSSIGFMSLSNRQFVLTDDIMEFINTLLPSPKDNKVLSYIALVYLASSDIDKQLVQLRSLGVTQKFQQIILDESAISNNDLKRWGTSLVEKGQLFTISMNNSVTNESLQTSLHKSINWPPTFPLEDIDSTSTNNHLLPINDSYLSPKFPEGSPLTDDSITQLHGLGLNLDRPLFRISRLYGSTHGLCSNCDREGKSEELVFRPHNLTPHQYQALINRGWYRRGAVKLFRYRYNHNISCSDWETRVTISEFDPRKRNSHRKVLRRMPEERLTIETIPTQFVQESYELYNLYHLTKHDKPRKSQYSYCEHVVNGPVCNQTIDGFQYGTFHQLYRLDGKLVAVGVIDIVPNGIVSIYMWYSMSKDITKLSFGTYSALKEIEFAQKLSQTNPNIKYYYMQGWNGNNHKLAYKANFEPEEFYSPCTVSGWIPSLAGVAKAQDEYRKLNSSEDQVDASAVSEGTANVVQQTAVVSGQSLQFDRDNYYKCIGSYKADISKLVVCLNGSHFMYLYDMFEVYSISDQQRKLMEERFEELVLAVGNELASNMVIDIKACP